MNLHEDYEDNLAYDYDYKDNVSTSAHKKLVRRRLEEKLELRRLKEECKDDFDELNGEFDWNMWDKE